MKKIFLAVLIGLALIAFNYAMAQDPKLPATNLGLSNLRDGSPPGTGWFFQEYVQSYTPHKNVGPRGETTGGDKISSLLSMNQIIYVSGAKIADGNFGFTVLLPIAKITASNLSGKGPSINPGVLGDIITGPFIQWFDKRLFNMKIDHRFEFDVISPIGSYNEKYNINPSSHLFSLTPNYIFTIYPTERFSLSMRHIFNYNFKQIGKVSRPGMSYNFNYSLEYLLTKSLNIEIAGYYLTQLEQDSYMGSADYFQNLYQLADTRERVFAYGPGIGYVTPTGLAFELKTMWEGAVRNRSQGLRSTLVMAYRLHK
jgi:hypothetical protein